MNNKPNQTPNRKESDLVIAVSGFLANQGYKVRTEVPSLGQSADIVAIRGRWVTFIEVKVHDWRKAIGQCRAHKLVADFTCIAVGTVRISDAAIQAAREEGIGLIHILGNGDCVWAMNPELNSRVWRPQRQKLAKTLRQLEYAC